MLHLQYSTRDRKPNSEQRWCVAFQYKVQKKLPFRLSVRIFPHRAPLLQSKWRVSMPKWKLEISEEKLRVFPYPDFCIATLNSSFEIKTSTTKLTWADGEGGNRRGLIHPSYFALVRHSNVVPTSFFVFRTGIVSSVPHLGRDYDCSNFLQTSRRSLSHEVLRAEKSLI
jgi:hypothetical protein